MPCAEGWTRTHHAEGGPLARVYCRACTRPRKRSRLAVALPHWWQRFARRKLSYPIIPGAGTAGNDWLPHTPDEDRSDDDAHIRVERHLAARQPVRAPTSGHACFVRAHATGALASLTLTLGHGRSGLWGRSSHLGELRSQHQQSDSDRHLNHPEEDGLASTHLHVARRRPRKQAMASPRLCRAPPRIRSSGYLEALGCVCAIFSGVTS